jgi:CRISPR-associated endoribonuclease Cas6
MKVYEITMLVFLINDIDSKEAYYKLSKFIDSKMGRQPELLKFHYTNTYKNYCFSLFYPLEEDKIYKSGKNYTIKIRTTDYNLSKFFLEELVNHYNQDIKGLTSKVRILPRKHINKIYSITPAVLKTDDGYWKGKITLDEYEKRIKENLIKKYNILIDTKIDEDFPLFTSLEFINKKPIAINYKGKKILGDKISLNINDDKLSQELAYMSLGTGVLEMNARGAGYMNYKYI